MARLTPQEAAQKWSQRTSAAAPDYAKGVQRVQTAPGQLAAAKADKMLAGITDAINSKRWQAAVSSVSLQDWQQASGTVGAQRIAGGVQQAAPKMADMFTNLLNAVDQVQAQVKNLPDATLEDRIAKSAAFQRGMAAFKGKI